MSPLPPSMVSVSDVPKFLQGLEHRDISTSSSSRVDVNGIPKLVFRTGPIGLCNKGSSS